MLAVTNSSTAIKAAFFLASSTLIENVLLDMENNKLLSSSYFKKELVS